ncbi:510_t:CDS:2, partial [Gigaspora rosea]
MTTGAKDLTKPFYHGSNSESIENFSADFEGYATMKDWNEAKMRLVVGLYVAESLCEWVMDIMQNNADWAGVKAAILKSAKAKYDVKMKIERLMNLKLNEDESIVSYTNRFDACAKKVKTEVSNHEVKRWYLRGIPVSVVEEELADQTDLDVDRLSNAFPELKICRVSQNSQAGKDIKKIDRLESSINELTKLVKNMATSKDQPNQNQPTQNIQGNWRQKQTYSQSPSNTQHNQANPRRYYNCGQEGADVRYFEIMETSSGDGDEYLKIEM